MAENLDFSLIKRLTRIFSGPLVRKNTNSVQKIKRRYFNRFNFQLTPWNFQGLNDFQKNEYRIFDNLTLETLNDRSRILRYMEYEQMETMPEISKALDIYADESTTSTHLQDVLKIESTDSHIKEVLHNLFYNVLNIKNNLWGWVRQAYKYGDYYQYLHLDQQLGVTWVLGLPEKEMKRLEGLDPSNPDYVKFRWEGTNQNYDFENFQIIHYRLSGNERNFPYGVSVLESSRRIFRQLTMQEDVMMSYRIVRAPERRAIYVDVTGVPPEGIGTMMQNAQTSLRRNMVMNPDEGQVHLRYNPISIEDDVFIPVMGKDSGTRIETLPGGQYVGVIDDIKYLRNKLFTALGVPSSYLEDKEGAEDKDSLSQKDVRFAATVGRLQSHVVDALEKIAEVHLLILGYRGEDLVNFKLMLNIPSKIWELQELEFWQTKLNVVASAEGKLNRAFTDKKFFGFTDAEARENRFLLYGDAKMTAALEAIKTPPEAGMGGLGGDLGGLGGDMGGLGGDMMGGDAGGLDLGGDIMDQGAEEAGGAPPEAGGESLLAMPGSSARARGAAHRTPNAHSDYAPVAKDERRENAAGSRARGMHPSNVMVFNRGQRRALSESIVETSGAQKLLEMSSRIEEILGGQDE